MTQPVLALQAPGDAARWFVVEQAGRVLVFPNDDAATAASTFIDITSRVTSGGERGLLGMAFDPLFATNRRVYLDYTRGGSSLQTVIARYTSPDDGSRSTPRARNCC